MRPARWLRAQTAKRRNRIDGKAVFLTGGIYPLACGFLRRPTLIKTARKHDLMKRFTVIVSASLLALPLFGQDKSPQLKDQKDKVSYSIGMQIGFNLGRQKVDINPDILAAGIKDAIAGKPQLTTDQVKDVMAQFEKDMEQKQKELGEKNKTEGAKFLEENKKKPGVKTTASGLQYKLIKEGTGTQPKATDMVTVNYRGTLIDGFG